MDVTLSAKKTAIRDWYPEDIIAALRKKGWSLRKLSIAMGLSEHTLKSVMHRPYPKAEKIIAEVLGEKPETIWPARYAKRNFTPVLPPSLQNSVRKRFSNTEMTVPA